MSDVATPSPATSGGAAPAPAASTTGTNGAAPGTSQTPAPTPGAGERPAEGAPPVGGETKAQAQARRMVTKHYGKEREWDLDNAEHLRELQVLAEIGGSGREKFHEAQKMREEAEAERALLKKDPWALLEKHGLNPDELAEQRVLALLERQQKLAQMTPEDQARSHVQTERQKLQEEKEAFERQQHESARDRETERILPIFTENVPKALKAVGLADAKGAPIGPAVDMLNKYLGDVLASGKPIGAEDIEWAAKATRQDAGQMLQGMTASLEGQALVDFLGKEVANKLRQWDVSEFKRRRNEQNAPPKPPENPVPKEPERGYMTPQEYERKLKLL